MGHNFTFFFLCYSTTCLLMKFLLKPRCKVSSHLSNSVTSSVSYSGMLKKYFPQIVNKQLWKQKWKHFEIITRTILTGSWRNSKTKLTISFKIPSICWWQPSPMAESAIKPACLYFQSATEEGKWRVTHFGNYQELQRLITFSLQGLGDTGGGRVKNRRWKLMHLLDLLNTFPFSSYILPEMHKKIECLIQAKSRPRKKNS